MFLLNNYLHSGEYLTQAARPIDNRIQLLRKWGNIPYSNFDEPQLPLIKDFYRYNIRYR